MQHGQPLTAEPHAYASAGGISAAEALRQACYSLKAVCAHTKDKFQAAVAERKAEMGAGGEKMEVDQ